MTPRFPLAVRGCCTERHNRYRRATADIKTNGLWVITNGVGVYTAPAPATTAEVRDRRRVTLARNIIKNWLPAANGLLGIADAAVNLRLGLQLDALVRCITANASVDDHYDVRHSCRSRWSTAMTSCCTPGLSGITPRTGTTVALVGHRTIIREGQLGTFHTINQNLAGSPSQGNTGGTNHPNVTTNTGGNPIHSIGCVNFGNWLIP